MMEGRSEGLGKGSEFIVSLPILPANETAQTNQQTSGDPADAVRKTTARKSAAPKKAAAKKAAPKKAAAKKAAPKKKAAAKKGGAKKGKRK
jgi:hypothetical protein